MLVRLTNQGRLRRATETPVEELVEKQFYIGSLLRQGYWFKTSIIATNTDLWPVALAMYTGPAEFVYRLLVNPERDRTGFLPNGWRISDNWRVYEPDGTGDERQIIFQTEREFIEAFCGQWIEPERR
jgi:hypothetical protein